MKNYYHGEDASLCYPLESWMFQREKVVEEITCCFLTNAKRDGRLASAIRRASAERKIRVLFDKEPTDRYGDPIPKEWNWIGIWVAKDDISILQRMLQLNTLKS